MEKAMNNSKIIVLCALFVFTAFSFSSCDKLSGDGGGGDAVPDPPSGLEADALTGATIKLTWTDNSDNEDGFVIERSTDAGFGSSIRLSADEDAVEYIDTGLPSDLTYHYRAASVIGETLSAWSNTDDAALTSTPSSGDITVEVSYVYEPTNYGGSNGTKLYAVWIANEDEGFYQNIFIGTRIHDQDLQGIGAPFWEYKVRPHFTAAQVDAVTRATNKKQDFTVSAVLSDPDITEFTVYFETDHSWDGNDWFGDQPAIVYAADVDLDDGTGEYAMELAGWVPYNGAQTALPDVSPITAINESGGELQTETRYITHHKNPAYDYDTGVVFGDPFVFDPDNPELKGPATDLVKGGLTVTVTEN